MKKMVILTLVALVAAGCSRSSGPMKIGPDAYLISVRNAPIKGGAQGARIKAINMGTHHCAKQNKQFVMAGYGELANDPSVYSNGNATATSTITGNQVTTRANSSGFAMSTGGTATIQFRCIEQ